MLVVHDSLLSIAESARDGAPDLKRLIVIEPTSSKSDSFWGLVERSPATPPPVEIDPKQDLAALPYSSGTTGISKGVMLTHFNMAANLRQFIERPGEALQQTESDVLLVHLPLFHIYGMQVLMNAVIATGGTQVVMGRFDMEEMLRLLADHRVTHLYTVPPVGIGLSLLTDIEGYDLSAMEAACLAAAPASEELQLRIQNVVGFPVFQAYGMTELSPVSNVDYIEPERMTPGSVGPAIADTEERVVDLETASRDVPAGEVGELLVRGPQVMKGYYNNEEATRETIDEDGWLYTGDIVRMNEDGCGVDP